VRALIVAVAALAGTAQVAEVQELRGPEAGMASHPTPAFGPGGRLWLAFEHDGFVYVTSSEDLGRSFTPAVTVNPGPEPIDANGEGRPKIAVLDDGTVLVSWTQKLDKPFTGLIRFSRSTDGGKSFSAPVTINDDGLVTGHRFDALAVAPSGTVILAWIDKRDLERARSSGVDYRGAAIYTALSRDGGKTFEPNRKLDDHVCECCRLSFAFDGKGEARLLFRDLLPGSIRDHSLARGVGDPGTAEVHRATFDEWKIDACPHHGPSLWISDDDVHHVVWFSAGERSGIGAFYGRSTDGGLTFSEPMTLGSERASHPFVLGMGATVYITWMEADGRESVVYLQRSTDGGIGWSAAESFATSGPGADHPLLVSNGHDVFLSWFTKQDGYRLVSLTEEASSE